MEKNKVEKGRRMNEGMWVLIMERVIFWVKVWSCEGLSYIENLGKIILGRGGKY